MGLILGTKVRLSNGFQKEVQDLQVGDILYTPNGPAEVQGVNVTGPVDQILYRVSSGAGKCTFEAAGDCEFSVVNTCCYPNETICVRASALDPECHALAGDNCASRKFVVSKTELCAVTTYEVCITSAVDTLIEADGCALVKAKTETCPCQADQLLINTTPLNMQTIDNGQPIILEFALPMNQLQTQALFSVSSSVAGVITGTFSWSIDQRILTWTPNGIYQEGAEVTATLAAGAMDRSGSCIEQEIVTLFNVLCPVNFVEITVPMV